MIERGCRTVKVKVGSPDLADDEARVASVRDVLDTVLGRGRGAIRIDANGAWDVARGTLALRRLGAYGIEYVEQPCRTVDELRAAARALVDVPFAVDETIRTSARPEDVRVREYADVAVLKPAPLGGVAALLRVAEAIDVPVVVSGSLDSSVGLDVAHRRRGGPRRPPVRLRPRHRVRCSRPTSSETTRVAGGRACCTSGAPLPTWPPCWPHATGWPRTGPRGGVERLTAAWAAGAGERSGWLVVGRRLTGW